MNERQPLSCVKKILMEMDTSLCAIKRLLLRMVPCLIGYSQTVFSQVSTEQSFCLVGDQSKVTLAIPQSAAPDQQWRWTSHDGRHTNVTIVRKQTNREKWKYQWTRDDSFLVNRHTLSVKCTFENGGVFSFVQISQTEEVLARYEVFAVQFNPRTFPASDVSVSFHFSRLPDRVNLLWQREQEHHTSKPTLSFDNIIHIIIHNVEKQSDGKYYLRTKLNGTTLWSIVIQLRVETSKVDQQVTLYRESSNSSTDLICKTQNNYNSATWARITLLNSTQHILTHFDRMSSVLKTESFSSPSFSGRDFPLKISPLTFEDAGMYACFYDYTLIRLFKLITIKGSAVLTADQQVVLMCDVSEVRGSVTLAWLRMENSDRGVVVAKTTLTDKQLLRTFNWSIPRISVDELDWTCAVFTNDLLRAKTSLTLSLTNHPPSISEPNDESAGEQTVIIVALLSLLLAGILAAALVVYVQSHRKDSHPAGVALSMDDPNEPVYENVASHRKENGSANDGGPARGYVLDEVHYSSFSHGEARGTAVTRKEMDVVVYSAVNFG